MGNDGGTILKRLSTGRTTQQKNNDARRQSRKDNEDGAFETCALSCQPLFKNPLVSDYKGKLYLKEKLLEHLLARARSKKEASLVGDNNGFTPNEMLHIKGLQDTVDLRVAWDPSSHHIQCPVTGTTSKHLAYLRPCGCVMSYGFLSDLATKSTSVTTSLCAICQTPFDLDYDIVVLNPLNDPKTAGINNESYDKLRALALTHAKRPIKKKLKKPKQPKRTPVESEPLESSKRHSSESYASTTKKQKV